MVIEVCKKCGQRYPENGMGFKGSMPFSCGHCGGLLFGWQAIRDIVFIWPQAPKEVSEGGLLIPEKYRKDIGFGIVLSVGKGYWDMKGKWHGTELEVGMSVIYNKEVPWRVSLKAPDGRDRLVPVMGEQDVLAIVRG